VTRAAGILLLLAGALVMAAWETFAATPLLVPFWLAIFVIGSLVLHLADRRELQRLQVELDQRWTIKELVELPMRHGGAPAEREWDWNWPEWRPWSR
jgi:uncharacterized protein (DUF2062 family)